MSSTSTHPHDIRRLRCPLKPRGRTRFLDWPCVSIHLMCSLTEGRAFLRAVRRACKPSRVRGPLVTSESSDSVGKNSVACPRRRASFVQLRLYRHPWESGSLHPTEEVSVVIILVQRIRFWISRARRFIAT